jgi:hypothetical protein
MQLTMLHQVLDFKNAHTRHSAVSPRNSKDIGTFIQVGSFSSISLEPIHITSDVAFSCGKNEHMSHWWVIFYKINKTQGIIFVYHN